MKNNNDRVVLGVTFSDDQDTKRSKTSSEEQKEELSIRTDGDDSERSSGSKERNILTTTAAKAVGAANAVKEKIIPKFQILPWKDFLLLAALVSVPTILYIAGFTKMGYGVQVYNYLSDHFEKHAYLLGGGLAAASFILYVFDVHYWKTRNGKIARRFFYFIIVTGIIVLVLSVSGSAPYGPISVFLVMSTLWIVSIQRMFYSDIEARNFVSWLGGPFFAVSTLTFLAWFIWTFIDDTHEWTLDIKLIDAARTGCDPDFTDREDCRGDEVGGVCFSQNNFDASLIHFPTGCDMIKCPEVYGKCTNTFIIWSGPFLASVGLLFLSFFTTMVQERVSTEQEIARFSKIWLFLLFVMWVTASLAGAGADVTFTLAALTLAGFIASGIFLAAVYRRVEREDKIQRVWDNFQEKYADYMDMARGLVFVTCSPIFLSYFVVSSLKQRIRLMQCFTCNKAPVDTKSLRHIGASSWLTIEARRLLREFQSWNRAQVYTWAVYWGIAFITLTVIASKFTTLFLSWLIEETQEMSLGIVTAIMVGVGLTMFLLPPVPGAPVYLTVGIIIIPVSIDTIGLAGCLAYGVVVSLALKLLATALQQKAIGSLLKESVRIRKMVGVNSTIMRAFKLLLSEPGLGLPKVSILTGGPDWPTSVFCGIIDLPLIPILIGTIPCLGLIIPTVLTGSFTYMAGMADEEGNSRYPWAGVASSVAAAVAAMVLFGNMILAAYYVEETVSKRQGELDALPYDEEVKKLDEEEEALNKCFDEVTEWDMVPLAVRLTLFSAVCCMVISCYMVFFFATTCFEEYSLTDTIGDKLGGEWTNLVKFPGWVALALFVLSIILFVIFSSWANRTAAEKLKEDEDAREMSDEFDVEE